MGKPASDPDSPTGLAAAALVRRLPDESWGGQIQRLEARRTSGGASGSVIETTDLGLGHDPPLARWLDLPRPGSVAFAMPAEDGLRLDDEQTRPPVSPQAGKPTPEDPVSPMEPRALQRALEDGTLLAERQVLRSELGAALKQLPGEDGDDLECAH
jgi:hypothetical protein